MGPTVSNKPNPRPATPPNPTREHPSAPTRTANALALVPLDHQMLAADPMTYLRYSGHKTFQDVDSQCGESSNRACMCGYTRQNSVGLITKTVGLKGCTANCSGKTCGSDGCGGTCGSACGAGQACDATGHCAACTPQCSGKSCGPDGCGGVCGMCAADEGCDNGTCSSAGP